MKSAFIALLVFIGFFVAPYSCEHNFLSDSFIRSINTKQSTWTAKKNFDENTPIEYLKSLASLKGRHPNPTFKFPIKKANVKADGIPETFDSRDVWPFCDSIRKIRNQGGCGSCWAFGAVESMSDRLCIFSAGAQNFEFSPEELISCCSDCGFGCNGGYLLPAWQYWVTNGIPSGSDQPANEGCRPYSAEGGTTPACNKQCVPWYNKAYGDDLRYGVTAYEVTTSVDQMQHEIMVNGPVEVMFEVFEDFYSYGAGVYQHTSGNSVGFHAVKAVGWGTENGVPYWLIANSWGAGWGGLGGFFKILRGYNHVQIESNVVAGIPRL